MEPVLAMLAFLVLVAMNDCGPNFTNQYKKSIFRVTFGVTVIPKKNVLRCISEWYLVKSLGGYNIGILTLFYFKVTDIFYHEQI